MTTPPIGSKRSYHDFNEESPCFEKLSSHESFFERCQDIIAETSLSNKKFKQDRTIVWMMDGTEAQKKDRGFALGCIKENAWAYLDCGPALINDASFILEAIILNPSVLRFLQPEYR